MSVEKRQPFAGVEPDEAAQAELPTMGTPLNPIESTWVFHQNPAAVRPEDLASAMPQGE